MPSAIFPITVVIRPYHSKCPSASAYTHQRMSDKLSKMSDQFFKKMENHARAEGVRLSKPNHGKLRLIGTAIGVVVVILLAIWMSHH